MKRRKLAVRTTKHSIPDTILSPCDFGRLLEIVRDSMLSIHVLLDPNAGEKAIFARHCAMHILRNYIGESVEAVLYRFSATAEEVEFALKDVAKALKSSWGFEVTVKDICRIFPNLNPPHTRVGK